MGTDKATPHKQINVKVSDEEHQRIIDAMIKIRNLNKADYCRKAVLAVTEKILKEK